jgi:hypothetical protein
LQPLINFNFALKPLNVPNFGSGVVSLDLPVALGKALVFEDDPRRFAHGHQLCRCSELRDNSERPAMADGHRLEYLAFADDHRPHHSSSASRRTAGACGFFDLIHCGNHDDWSRSVVGYFHRFVFA